jgi:hypothetical protein
VDVWSRCRDRRCVFVVGNDTGRAERPMKILFLVPWLLTFAGAFLVFLIGLKLRTREAAIRKALRQELELMTHMKAQSAAAAYQKTQTSAPLGRYGECEMQGQIGKVYTQ